MRRLDNLRVVAIDEYLRDHCMTKKRFCELCGISYATLWKIMSNRKDFRIGAIYKIYNVLNPEGYELFYRD